jgi:cytidylate kinase
MSTDPAAPPGFGKLELDLDDILARALAALPETTRVSVIAEDDRLTDDQMRQILAGQAEAVEGELDSWAAQTQDASVEMIFEAAVPNRLERAAIRCDPRLFQVVRETILERDETSPFDQLIEQTDHSLLRYDLGLDVSHLSEEPVTPGEVRRLARALGIEVAVNRAALTDLLERGGQGDLHLLWYGDPRPLLRAACDRVWGAVLEPGPGGLEPRQRWGWAEVAWSDPHLLSIAGAGYVAADVQLEGVVTRRFDGECCYPGAFGPDSHLPAYEVAGIFSPGYSTPVAVRRIPQLEQGGHGLG